MTCKMVLILITFQKMDEATLFLKTEHEHFVLDNKSVKSGCPKWIKNY